MAFGVEKLCHVSSIATLGNRTEHQLCITEETERNNELHYSDYSISKYGAELEVWRGYQEGLPIVIVNPGVILALDSKNQAAVYSLLKSKGFTFYTKGKIGIVAVEDVVKAMYLLMNSPISGERFILVAEDLTYQQLFCILAKAFNIQPPKWHASKVLTAVIWRLDWIFSTLFLLEEN